MDLLRELEPVVAVNLVRHLGMAKEWHLHDYVPRRRVQTVNAILEIAGNWTAT